VVRRALPPEETKEWPRSEARLPSARADAEAAFFDFFAAARCFLHSATAATTHARCSHRMKQRPGRCLETRAPPIQLLDAHLLTGTRASSIAARLLMEHLPRRSALSPVPPPPLAHSPGTMLHARQGRCDSAGFNDTAAILRIFSLMATHATRLAGGPRTGSPTRCLCSHLIPEGRICGNGSAKFLLGAWRCSAMHALACWRC